MTTIFISHAAADKPVIDDFFDLLQTGCDMRREQIFCSSVDGAGIETGEDFVRWIHENIASSELVIFFITPNYYASKFCVAEMGAAWALKKDVFPLIITGLSRDAGTVLSGKQTEVVGETGLDHLRDTITKIHKDAGESTPRWSLKRDQFLKNFREKIGLLPAPSTVDSGLLKAEKEKVVAAMELNQELTDAVTRLEEYVSELEKLKDREGVTELKTKYSDKEERYSALVEELIDCLNNLSAVEARCVYGKQSGNDWCPDRYVYDEYRDSIEYALQCRWIQKGESLESGWLEPNTDHPKMHKVFGALQELDRFISVDLTQKEKDDLADEKGYLIDLNNREYWVEELRQSGMPI